MALLPPFYLDTVVAIGVDDDPQKREWVGTGFLYGHLTETRGKDKDYRVWFITNKHVLKGLSKVYLKFNSAVEQNSADYPMLLIDDKGAPLWHEHPTGKADIAATLLSGQYLQKEQRQFKIIRSDEHIMDKEETKKAQITEGDRVFVLGFPMGLVAPERQYVICRSGIFSRIRDYLDDRTEDYLIDALVFPGNSGGPVILCPSALAIEGTSQHPQAQFVGMVKGYVPYEDVAISRQTGRIRVVFSENSGLAAVEGTQTIVETISSAEQQLINKPTTSPGA